MSVVSNHNAGFFSCCAVKLYNIIHYINTHSKLPDYIDSSAQFVMYKKDNTDVTYDYFEDYNHTNDILITYPIDYHYDYQFIDYSKFDYIHIIPVIKKYFSPSKKVINTVTNLEQKYNINYNSTIAVYYRGTDKYIETQAASFDIFYSKIEEIINLNVNKQIIIQTDTAQFIDYIIDKKLKNVIIFNENATSYTKHGIHKEKTNIENYNDMFNLFATFIILSKCNYLICSSGNCSQWMMMYRENSENVHQFCNNVWYNHLPSK